MGNLRLSNQEEAAFDQYAAAALGALISKMPTFDKTGREGLTRTTEEMTAIKSGIADTALEYASFAMKERQKYLQWVSDNL